jgi:O-antigen/teichoic acid export membrane protein
MNDATAASVGFARGTVSRDAAWSLAYTGAMRLSTLGVSIAIARLAGPVGTGALGVTLQVTALATMIAGFNLPQSLARHLASDEDSRRRGRLLKASARLLLGVSSVTGVALMVLSGWLATHVYRSSALSPVLFWCGPLVIATAATAWVEGALQGLSRFSTLTRWGALVSALDLTLGLLAAWFGVVGVLVARAAVRARPSRERSRAGSAPIPRSVTLLILGSPRPPALYSVLRGRR